MTTEIVEQRILTADEGMYLTNGDSIVKTVVLPINADASVWYEITEEKAQEICDKESAEIPDYSV